MANRADNANRANVSSLSGSVPSDGGSAWVDATSAVAINSNEFAPVNAFAWAPANLETSTAVGKVSFIVRALGNSGFGFRYVDASNFWLIQVQSGSLGLFKRVSGTFTQYGSTYTGTISAGDSIEVEVTAGNVWTVKQNGTTRINPGTADSAHSSATKVCLAGFSGSARYDDLVFTDTAGGGAQTVAIGQASESDAAQAFTAAAGSVTAIGQASETDSAQALVASQRKAIGQAAESNTAQAFASAQRKAIGQATETDAAQALAASQRKAIGQSIEVDTAQPVSYSAPGVVGQATETDAAQPFAARQARAIGQALESNASQPITASTGTAVAIGLALEIDTAGAFAALGPIAIAIGQAQEVDLARAMTSSGGDASIDPATIRRVARSPALPRLARAPAPWRSTNGL